MIYSSPDQLLVQTTTRQNGVSSGPYTSNNLSYTVNDKKENVDQNRQRLAQEVGIDLNHWVFARQCHSDQIAKVDSSQASRGAYDHHDGIENVDALYTFDKNLVLAFFHADCVPLLFYDTTSGLIGAIHAGWQGTLKEITQKSLTQVIVTEDLDPKNIHVIIGPALSFESCSLNPDLVDIPYTLNKNIQLDENNHLKLNVVQMNIDQCLACGIPLENIDNQSEDTLSNPDKYFSFQRDQETGRHLSFIVSK